VIDYQRDNWWRICFSLRGTVLPHILGRVGLLTGFCLLLCLLNDYFLKQHGYPLPSLDQLGHIVVGVALGMLLAFRGNAANARFWEARSHWGVIINTARNLVRAAAVYAGPAEDLAGLVTAYVVTLRESLRGNRDLAAVRPLVSAKLFDRLLAAPNAPALLARSLSGWVAARLAEGRIDTVTAARLEGLICVLVDCQGGCEKIRRTPMPFVYAALIKQIILLYLITLPFVLVARMDFAAPLVVAVVAFGFLGIEEAGILIEDPFSTDPSHLPLEQLCKNIAADATAVAADEH
jgi:putative membrane protein